MDEMHPITFFSFFHFLVENKENQLYFRLFFSWYHTLVFSKTQNWKANFYRVFPCFGHPYSSSPGDGLGETNPESQPGWRWSKSLPARPAYSVHKCPFCIQSHYKAPPFRNILSQFSERWNLITSCSLPSWSIYINKAFKLTSRASPRLEVGKTIRTSSAGAEPRRTFCLRL